MRDPLSPLRHAATTRQVMPTTTTLMNPPRLWPALEPARQQHLAQCLAELLRRLRSAPLTASTEEAKHEPS